jgi:uncharacterized protein (UPF0332 family)
MLDSLPEELHAQAELLLGLPANQANIRRSISTNYYALFHFLIRHAVRLWEEEGHRAKMCRQFNHKRMKEASSELVNNLRPQLKRLPDSSPDHSAMDYLEKLAKTFIDLQQKRHEADYDVSQELTWETAHSMNIQTGDAINGWEAVATKSLARDYLYSLLFKDRS